MEAIQNYCSEIVSRIMNSKAYLAVRSFLQKYVTRTDFVMGSLFVGGFFFKQNIYGISYLVPKVCATYFIGKTFLCFVQKKYPSFYEERVHMKSGFFQKVLNKIVPEDYMNCYKVVMSVFQPYLSKFDGLTPFSLLGGIYKAGTTQEPIKLSKKPITSADKDVLGNAALYCEMATGIYGSQMVYGLMREISSYEDLIHLMNGKKNREGYTKAFVDHCHIQPEDILYINWGCEDELSPQIETEGGISILPPPYFLVRHEATKSIVLCIRGTWDIKDFIADFKCTGSAWNYGQAHEGIALIVNQIVNDAELNSKIAFALESNQDYRLVAVGHSLGAGIASLLTINWRAKKLYNKPICYAFAPPPILSYTVADKGVGYIYSFVNEDDVVPRLSKDGILDVIHLIVGSCHVKEKWFHRVKKTFTESYASLFGSKEVVQMYLPGTVYYLHPCIDQYDQYEKRKRMNTGKSDGTVVDMMKTLMERIPASPGGVIYDKGSNFPNKVIITPMLLVHHFAFNYESLIKKVYSRIDEVAVDIPSA